MMLWYRVLITGLIAMAVLGGCNKKEQTQAKDTHVKIDFVEYENNSQPYPTRLIVTNKFMRFDDGEGSLDYILFNRETDTIYSVNNEDQTVLAVKHKDFKLEPPFELKLEDKNLGTLNDAPKIQGLSPLHYQFSANGKICYNVVAVEGLMPDVVAAMKAYKEVLASDSKTTFHNIPADLHDACDMSMSTFAATRHLKYGFPIQEWSVNGDGRTLINYDENFQPDPALFVLPEKFRHFTVQELREGKVDTEQ